MPRHSGNFTFHPLADEQYTVNGKKIEVAVKNIVCGRPVIASNTVANPESLDWFKEWVKNS
jgi:acetoacetyl-CoA synthetase